LKLSKFIGWFCLLAVLSLCAHVCPLHALEGPAAIPEVPVKGMVTMLDIGADKCIPCKMMAPILKELEEEYQGEAAIIFIDIWKRPEQAQKFRIRVIPTQIFYDKGGNEAQRHEGFMDKKAIVEMLERLGVKK
jgi:thioredoxin 1